MQNVKDACVYIYQNNDSSPSVWFDIKSLHSISYEYIKSPLPFGFHFRVLRI